ncbi:MAG: hypothetical protein WC959_10015 [Kiritimatiellales bacterium]
MRKNKCIIIVTAVLMSLSVTANVIYSNGMNYANNAALRTDWTTVYGEITVQQNASFGAAGLAGQTPSPASGSFMSAGNAIAYDSLGTTVTGDWSLSVKMLHNNYGRGHGIFLLNEAGTQGYGIMWTGGNVSQYGGKGTYTIRAFNNPTHNNHSTFGAGNVIGSSVNGSHWLTGYEVTATSGTDQDNATFDTSTWNDFVELTLTWEAETGILTLFEGANQIIQVTDTSYSSFSRVYIRGNNNGFFDDIVVTAAVPEAGTIGLFLISGAGLFISRHFLTR